ncbi:hypothetical protein [Klebsiella aerogenes]|uniref:hypothetical protein n=1 Tax=Klebsiella aerogenes TaxID=548 RepID=UPI000DA1B39F|nr:hypothetical protein [Klebsiella aerogenes]HCB2860502.1 hypothetical protein [Klebsiella aerogenes]HCB2865899.1 hypothetical protein [Klebsiella aerogenes]HCB2881450.1 hypothetical protein [Klebsiella aerogenes]HCB3346319.1 hypothetical protein [Klebsiella aerogenes]HCM1812570.1 hypothetical protein [Klebsiella aerogenes]
MVNLAAGRNIRIVSGENHHGVDARHKKTGSNDLFSRTTTTTRDAFSRDTALASHLGSERHGGISVSYCTSDMKVTDTLNEATHRASTVDSA